MHLVGTITRPDAAAEDGPPVVALLTNAGVISRIGPRRVNVKIAHRLAAVGIPSFRWDLSGLGDSGRSTQSGSAGDEFVRDTADAMQAVSSLLGVEAFVMIGFCSGAQVAFQAALQDDRLRGVVLFDHFKFGTWKSSMRWWLKRFRTLGPGGVLAASARRIGHRLRSRADADGDDLVMQDVAIANPSRAEYAALVLALIRRDVRLLFVYSGGFPRIFNYDRQFNDLFRKFDIPRHTESVYLPNTDHLITPAAEQSRLVDLIVEWVVARSGESSSGSRRNLPEPADRPAVAALRQ